MQILLPGVDGGCLLQVVGVSREAADVQREHLLQAGDGIQAQLLTIAGRLRAQALALDQALCGGAAGPAQKLKCRQLASALQVSLQVNAQAQAQQRAVVQAVPIAGTQCQAAVIDEQPWLAPRALLQGRGAVGQVQRVTVVEQVLVQQGQCRACADQKDFQASHGYLLGSGR
ncbi:hypothetical protein D3C79_824950 [compost metagenome]